MTRDASWRRLEAVAPLAPPRLRVVPLALPRLASGEVEVRVVAAGVNPIDVRRASGYGRRLLSLKGAGRFPITTGNDLVGRVTALGSGVAGLAVGDAVIGVRPMGPGGTHGDAVHVAARHLRRLPAGVDADAAALPYAYLTMRLALAGAGLDRDRAAGREVLVLGASGSLGQLALQTLAGWGARVAAVCSTGAVDRCRSLGAQQVIDRQQANWRERAPQVHATLNFGDWSEDEWLLGRLRPGSTGHATTVHALLDHFDRYGIVAGAWRSWRDLSSRRAATRRKGGPACRYAWTVFRPDPHGLDELVAALQGGLALPVACRAGLDDAATAFGHVAAGRAGRAVLVCDETDPLQAAVRARAARPSTPEAP